MAAKNSRKTGTRKPRGKGKPFKPGQSGNPAGRPKGVPNKASADVKRFCESLLDNQDYQAKFARAFVDRTLPPVLEQMVWFYGVGKPKESVSVQHRFPHKLLLGDDPPTGDD